MRYGSGTQRVTLALLAGLLAAPSARAAVQPPALPDVRIKRSIRLELANQTLEFYTKAATVKDLLKEAGIPVAPQLLVRPAPEAALEGVDVVVLPRLTMEIMEFPTEIPAPVKKIQKPLAFGDKVPENLEQVVNEGKDGEAYLKSLYFFQNHQLLGYTEKTVVKSQPVPREIVQYLPAPKMDSQQLAKFFSGNFRVNRKDPGMPIPKGPAPMGKIKGRLNMTATAYTSDDPGVGTRTALGWRLRQGIVAVDPRRIPLGTRLFIPGYGYGVAADTGGAIKGNKIDLAFGTRRSAFQFGRRKVDVYLLD